MTVCSICREPVDTDDPDVEECVVVVNGQSEWHHKDCGCEQCHPYGCACTVVSVYAYSRCPACGERGPG